MEDDKKYEIERVMNMAVKFRWSEKVTTKEMLKIKKETINGVNTKN